MSEWHYSQDGQQHGPVTSAQLKQLAVGGRIRPEDLIWKEGMAEWTPASRIKGLFAAGAAQGGGVAVQAARPVAAAPVPVQNDAFPGEQQPGSPIAYYNPTGDLGTRAARTLAGFPPPNGPSGEWPLSTTQLNQLMAAEGHRKHIRSLASLFQLFFLIGAIFSPFVILAGLFGTSMPGGARASAAEGAFLFGLIACLVAMTILYFFAARQTRHCRLWPACVFAAIYIVAILIIFIIPIVAMSRGTDPGAGPGLLIAFIISVIPAAFLYMCIKAVNSIPKFLAAPVWAQEALVAAKL